MRLGWWGVRVPGEGLSLGKVLTLKNENSQRQIEHLGDC